MHERAQAILTFTRRYLRAHDGRAPTQREIAAGIGITSSGVVHHHLVQLQMAGWVTWEPHAVRSLHVCTPAERRARLAKLQRPARAPRATRGKGARAS